MKKAPLVYGQEPNVNRERTRVFERFTPAAPAAGLNFFQLITQLPGFYARLVAVQYTLATSAVVANRVPGISFVVLGRPNTFLIPTVVVQAANVTQQYGLFVGWGATIASSATGVGLGPLPAELWFDSDFNLNSTITNLDAADQVSNIVIDVERLAF